MAPCASAHKHGVGVEQGAVGLRGVGRRAERRARLHDPVDPYSTIFKVYTSGRLKGAILPIDEEDGMRWESVELDGTVTRWRYGNQARDYLGGFPIISQ